MNRIARILQEGPLHIDEIIKLVAIRTNKATIQVRFRVNEEIKDCVTKKQIIEISAFTYDLAPKPPTIVSIRRTIHLSLCFALLGGIAQTVELKASAIFIPGKAFSGSARDPD